ncbi:hypothetical protein N4R57_13375 [Rhodobacteraceae bacterium D3-12]|nr:hypothetical protein N4R57_13375 [Rhodobacteraceae bacterium D3-12]
MPFSLLRFGAAVCLVAGLTACATAKGPFRVTLLSEPLCAEPHNLQAGNQEIGNPEKRRCALQKHLLPGAVEARKARAELAQAIATARAEAQAAAGAGAAPGEPVVVTVGDLPLPDENWAALADVNARPLQRSDEYDLAFVELADDGSLDLPWQLKAVKGYLDRLDKAGVQNYVVAYVHGWRHNAELRDGDIRKFRRMLAYSRAALNTRCVADGTYCNAAVTGVFIGWNGQRVKEGPSDINPDAGAPTGLESIAPGLTFWNRWDVSCRLGGGRRNCAGAVSKNFKSPLQMVLGELQGELRLRQGDARADKFLIFGHSMGGNMLSEALRGPAVAKINAHVPGRKMTPLVGDLVVLLNPAAEATAWAGIQRAERAKAELSGNNRLTCWAREGDAAQACSPSERQALAEWYRLYPLDQRPIYVSLTSAANWGTLKAKDREVKHDTATGQIFPFAKKVEGKQTRERIVAIGHYTPDYASQLELRGPAEGTSHEVAVLEGAVGKRARYLSRYRNAANPEASWCQPADGWLRETRETWTQGGTVANWDTSYLGDGSRKVSEPNIGGPLNKARIQWRQGMNLQGNNGALSVSPGTSPFWNARALDTAIKGHAGWANYATWCALNQMVLDDVTGLSKARKITTEVASVASRDE